jgi:tripartite-type tricarboxylate transporter receptor subunit TctC
MKLPRRTFLHLAAGVAALPAVSRIARAQAYPTRPVRIIIGFAPGGQNDLLARPVAQSLSERLGQPFVIENRPGAGSNVATEAVVRAAADGYTLLLINTTQAVNVSLYDRLNFDFIRDITPVAGIMLTSLVIVVNPSFPAKSTPEFIAYAKANPGKINYASSGIGVLNHVAGELFKTMTGTNMVHVPYRGGAPALIDLLGGQVQMMFATPASSIEYIRAGKLRALAVTAGRRSEALPDVPTVAEAVPGYEATDWYGIGVTKGTPVEIVERLNNEINSNLVDPKMKARLANLGGAPLVLSSTDFSKLIADDTQKWGKVIRAANIKPE